jgi:hypothetical protein
MSEPLQFACDEHGWCDFTPCPKCQYFARPPCVCGKPPKPTADAVVTIKIKGHSQMQFSSYKMPWGGWSISPTLAGKKVQQVLMRA